MASIRDDADRVGDDAERLGRSARRAVETGRDTVPDYARQAADRAREMIGDRADKWRGQAEDYADLAGERLEDARVFVVEHVQERPVTATLAALGVGFLLGALLSGSRR